jgi:hypothetical protein
MRRLSRLMLILALVLLAGVGALHAETVIERLVSPGPLSNAHAALETRCTACHRSFKRTTQPAQCLACHSGIARDRATHTRFHGMVTDARMQACRQCHVEHQGRLHALAPLNAAAFNHDSESIYILTGAHVRTRCAACHIGMAHFRETPQACAACHTRADIHRGRLGPQCQACHTTARWKDVLPFDHDRTRYPLTGAHRTTACLGCHVGEQWHGVSSQCVSCHVRADVHRGADGPHCAQCHLTTTWRAIRFDHDAVTAFPLREAHRKVACIGCHANTVRPAKAPVACVGCHLRDDVHRGADGPKCESCHSQTTWKVATFDHAKTSFPLVGYHLRVTCVACHPQSVDKVKVGARCIDCHKKDDVHHDALGPMCERCHKATGFRIPGVPRIQTPWHGTMEHDFPRSGLRD